MNQITRDKAKGAVLRAAQSTLGEMAFIDVIDAETPRDFEAGQLMFIEFYKPIHGRLLMSMPADIKKAIVENIHATDWNELSVSEIDDCLLELLNVLGGNFLRELKGGETKVQLSFPTVLFSLEEISDLDSFWKFDFDAEGIPFSVSLALHEEGE
ncbi:MAG: chemotaxis protein CheX [bacterium]